MAKTRKEYNAEYWERHKEEISKKRKEDYVKNRDVVIERNKQWLKDNRDKWNAYQRKYRARIKLDKQKKA